LTNLPSTVFGQLLEAKTGLAMLAVTLAASQKIATCAPAT
jgi:hypothetical protein